MADTDPTPKPADADAVTPADIVTPHEGADQSPTADVEQDLAPGILDPRRSRSGPDILEPPSPGLPPPDSSV